VQLDCDLLARGLSLGERESVSSGRRASAMKRNWAYLVPHLSAAGQRAAEPGSKLAISYKFRLRNITQLRFHPTNWPATFFLSFLLSFLSFSLASLA